MVVPSSRNYSPRILALRAWNALLVNWHLGFTAFGGPPVHFKIFNEKFVQKLKWIDEQMYQELFSISQALSGPASTKMLYCINLLHDGSFAALLSFLIWSLPVALVMYGLSIGIFSINQALPRPAYALLFGLNAATVGVIALAATQLSHKAITDKLTRVLIFLSGAAAMLYNALWYFPVLMLISGCATLIYDYRWLHKPVAAVIKATKFRTRPVHEESAATPQEPRVVHPSGSRYATGAQDGVGPTDVTEAELPVAEREGFSTAEDEARIIPREFRLDISWQTGTAIIGSFFLTFVVVMVLRGVLPNPPLLFSLFANMYLAGTVIFGGGPVVIPLLREYIVAEGWVSPRDFLIGLALIQAFPGPNVNFAVFLGSLTAINGGYNSAAGALISWVGIFGPRMVLVHGTMGIWSALRSRRWVKSILRGINAGAVGLIYTAVYRIWQVGYIDEGFQSGRSLGDDPWWVVVTATSYVGGYWFGISAPLAIVFGAVLGLIRYGVVQSQPPS
ncbi:chromate transporter-domain-containing protein [Biscogniauxia marginata]|nr:chromate transporter-domain-containing protein [Biscogniauxia marginata]